MTSILNDTYHDAKKDTSQLRLLKYVKPNAHKKFIEPELEVLKNTEHISQKRAQWPLTPPPRYKT